MFVCLSASPSLCFYVMPLQRLQRDDDIQLYVQFFAHFYRLNAAILLNCNV